MKSISSGAADGKKLPASSARYMFVRRHTVRGSAGMRRGTGAAVSDVKNTNDDCLLRGIRALLRKTLPGPLAPSSKCEIVVHCFREKRVCGHVYRID